MIGPEKLATVVGELVPIRNAVGSSQSARPESAATLANGDTVSLIEQAIKELSAEDARNASHVYARVLRNAIQKHLAVDDLHLGDVLMALRNAGYSIDRKTGALQKSDRTQVA